MVLRFSFLRICFFAMVLVGAGNVSAQTPRYMDPEVRLSAPDLSGLPRMRFLISLDFPPFNFADANKKPTGFNVDLARAICAELKIEAKCEIQAMPWGDLETALLAQRAEAIIAGTAISDEKRRQFGLSEAYFKFPARFIVHRETQIGPSTDWTKSLRGKRVAVVKGSAHEAMFANYFPALEAVSLDDAIAVNKAVKSKDVDLAFVDGVSASFWLTSGAAANCCAFYGGAYYSDAFLGFGMTIVTRQENTELGDAINAALQGVEESGKYIEIFRRYFPLSPHGDDF